MDFRIKVKPNSHKNELSLTDSTIVVRVKASPVDGKANKELLIYLSEILGIPKSKIEIKAGAGSTFKTIRISSEYDANFKGIIDSMKNQ